MGKFRLVFVLLLVALFIAGCKDKEKETEEIKPDDVFGQYVQLWEEHKFKDMYEMLTDEVKVELPEEEFVGRYEKIYQDLEVNNLKITFDSVAIEKGEEDAPEKATITFQISMDTIAGKVEYQHDAILLKETPEEEGEEATWKIAWDHEYIFDGMKPEDKVGLEYIEPERGEIVDRNGKALATTGEVNEVGLVPQWMEGNEEEIKSQVSELLGMSVEAIDAHLNASWVQPHYFVPIKRILPDEEELAAKLMSIPGVQINKVKSRFYPYGEAFGHLVGYVDEVTQEDIEKNEGYKAGDVIGKRGLEQLFEERLRGERGVRIYLEKPDGVQLDVVETPVKNGDTIQLTIDADMQVSLLNSFNGRAGTAIAIHPKSGETLAIVSSPSYDPNAYMFMTGSERQKLADDPLQPLINRFVNVHVPGSSIKPLTASIALEDGTITPTTTRDIKTKRWQKDSSWGGYHVTRVTDPGRPVDLKDAIVLSDNIYFAQTALEMGADTLIEGLKKFGFTEDIPFIYPLEDSQISNSGNLTNDILLADTSYGQGEMQVNIVHLAAAFTTFVNEGNMIKPILLKEEEEPNQIWKEKVISEKTAETIAVFLRQVVTDPEGTGRAANSSKVPLAGKTGTAEVGKMEQNTEGSENGWFVAYNTDKEDLLVVMTMENTQDAGGPVVVEAVRAFFEQWR